MTTASALLVACLATSQAPAPAPAQPPQHRVDYYLTELRVQSPDGKAMGAMVGLGRREYRPDERTIEQTDIALDPAPGALPTVVVLEWSVSDDGSSAEIKSRDGRIKGRARLAGPAWNWAAWNWNGAMKDVPGTFRNSTRTTRRGLATRSERLDASGKVLEVYEQVDTKITRETYDVLRRRLLPE